MTKRDEDVITPIIFLYMDTPHHRGAGGVYRGRLMVTKYTLWFAKYFGTDSVLRFAF